MRDEGSKEAACGFARKTENHPMFHHLSRWLSFLAYIVLMLAAVTTALASDERLGFTPGRITELIAQGKAREHGAVFAAYTLGIRTYLWLDAAEHHVFFFLRNGSSFGEYREERLAAGRFVEITECYLVVKARDNDDLQHATELPFVCRKETLDWNKQDQSNPVWVGSTVHWSFLWCDRNGNIIRHGKSKEQTLVRRAITVRVPKTQRAEDKEHWIHYFRRSLTAFEEEYGAREVRAVKLEDGEFRLFLVWPPSEPELVIELRERVANPPYDATPDMVRTKEILSTTVNLNTVTDHVITIAPN